jgi:hypothetical protein
MQKNESAELEAPDRANHCGYNWIDGGEIIGFALTSHGERFGLWAFWYGYSSFGGFMGASWVH